MKKPLSPSEADLARARQGRPDEDLAELARRAEADPTLAQAIATLGEGGDAGSDPGGVTPLQGTPVAPREADEARRTVPRGGGHRLLQSQIPTLPKLADAGSLRRYEGDPEGAGPVQELAPDLEDASTAGVPLDALREVARTGDARRGRAGLPKGVWLVVGGLALIAVAALVAARPTPGHDTDASASARSSASPSAAPTAAAPGAAASSIEARTPPLASSGAPAVDPTSQPAGTGAASADTPPEPPASPSTATPPVERPPAVSSRPTAATAEPRPPSTARPGSTGALPPGWSLETDP